MKYSRLITTLCLTGVCILLLAQFISSETRANKSLHSNLPTPEANANPTLDAPTTDAPIQCALRQTPRW
jgi:hypothetical protein